MDIMQSSLAKHKEWKGKIEVVSRTPINDRDSLSHAYTPGVAQPCLEIEKDPSLSYELTRRHNLVAVITDGTAVLGLGDIGPLAAMPVMEGKCALFKEFADVDAFPLCINSKDTDEIVINGAGSAGIAIAKHLLNLGVGNICMVDLCGILARDEHYDNPAHAEMAQKTNRDCKHGVLADAVKGADVFIGVSKPGLLTQDMIRTMNDKPLVFAMANPTPEIMPDLAKEAGAYIVGTGRSDFPNQINNVVAFPGVFKGALAVRAKDINEPMKVAATKAIAGCVSDANLRPDFILPDAFDRSVALAVAKAVAQAAIDSGVAGLAVNPL